MTLLTIHKIFVCFVADHQQVVFYGDLGHVL